MGFPIGRNLAAQAKDWSEGAPDWNPHSDEQNTGAGERLLETQRPGPAFSCVRFKPGKLDAQLLFRLLSEMAEGGNDQTGHYVLEHYHVEEAFKDLNTSPALTLDQKAGLEFAYIEVLARP